MAINLARTGRARIYVVTVVVTALCIAVTFAVDAPNFPNLSPQALLRAYIIDTALPLGLAAPLIYYFMHKLRELAIAHEQLQIYASTDSLTKVLNRGAFVTLVDAYLTEVRNAERDIKGALLIVDADNFKSVNDRFGHDRGDEALRLIAGAIKSVLRNVDLVGRIGGEEFAVFLPGTSPISAEAVAERIRINVSRADFAPMGPNEHLTVSIGGAAFDRQLPYNELFRVADQQLYRSKQNGRNRVSVSPIVDYDTVPAAA